VTLCRPGAGLIALGMCLAGGPAAAQGASAAGPLGGVSLVAPEAGAAFGWGQFPPLLRLEARLTADGPPARRFLTANVLSGEQPVDGVRLYDDGSHGDAAAGDGLFTAGYYPPEPGGYAVRVRAQWNDLLGKVREAYSQPVSFWVEAVPYADVVHPEAGGRVGTKTEVRGRLLLRGEPFREADPSLAVEAWTDGPEGARVKARRDGNRVTAPLEFPGVGPREVGLTVSVERRGRRLETTSEAKRIDVANPPLLLLILGGLAMLGYLLAPPRRPIPLWRHEFKARDAGGNVLPPVNVDSEWKGAVRVVVGDGDSVQAVLKGARGPLFAVRAPAGEKQAVIEAVPGERLSYEKKETAVAKVRVGESFTAGGYSVQYAEVRSRGARRFHRLLPTAPKLALLALGVALVCWGFLQYRQFFAQ